MEVTPPSLISVRFARARMAQLPVRPLTHPRPELTIVECEPRAGRPAARDPREISPDN
ncbi:hypothetical protein Ntsu_74520 [Nocardia sp. IFM 10818]